MPPEVGSDLEQLRRALDAANRGRASAEAQARDASVALHQERGRGIQAQEFAIDAEIRNIESAQQSLEQQFVELQEEGKFKEAAEAMRKMSEATTSLSQMRGQKAYLSQQRERAAAPPPDPLQGLTDKEKNWARENPQYTSDQAFADKANAAALYARNVLGVEHDSPEYFDHINRAVYPERYQSQTVDYGNNVDDIPRNGNGNGTGLNIQVDHGQANNGGRLEHTMEASPVGRSTDAPAMRIDFSGASGYSDQRDPNVQQREYVPAAGQGNGEALRSVAAPPSRNIFAAARRAQGQRAAITPTPDEIETAFALANSIEPDSEMVQTNNREAIIAWYYAHAHHPSNFDKKVKRSSWARDAIIG